MYGRIIINTHAVIHMYVCCEGFGMTELSSCVISIPSRGVCEEYSQTVQQGAIGVPSPGIKIKVP